MAEGATRRWFDEARGSADLSAPRSSVTQPYRRRRLPFWQQKVRALKRAPLEVALGRPGDVENNGVGMKLGLGTPELLPDLAIVDSTLTMGLPPRITADTGMDVLTHAIEAYTCTLRNDFADGLALKATELVFKYLPTAYATGSDAEARLRMHSASTIAGLAFGNAMLGLSHAMGHSMGAVLHVPHGRSVGLFLPYVMEFTANGGGTRYGEIAHFVHLPADDEEVGAAALVQAIRDLSAQVNFATSIKALGIERAAFDQALPKLVANAEADNQLFFNQRYAAKNDLARLFEYAYEGRSIDF